MNFIEQTKFNFDKISDLIFANLQSGEVTNISLDGENTNFVRFNNNRVRQTTHVEQLILTMQLQKKNKSILYKWPLTGNFEMDRREALLKLGKARAEVENLPLDTHQVPLLNRGESFQNFTGDYPAAEDFIQLITAAAKGSDLAGLLCLGPVISANRNSLGQSHWFSTDSFFMDYSLYDGPKAVKACYSNSKWNAQEWHDNLMTAKNQLSLMQRPVQSVQPGSHRVYLAPGAVSPLVDMLSWNALSQNSFQRGTCPFKKLGEKQLQLSEKLSVRENFDLGLIPRFNLLGELSAPQLNLIESGQLTQFLTSSRTAKEFSIPGNAACEAESLRSPEVLPGHLSRENILKKLETGLYISNLHYINWSDQMSARVTGITRFGCFWVEKGEILGPIKDLRFDNSLYDIWGKELEDLTDFQEIDPTIDTYHNRSIGGKKIPGMLISAFKFTL